jgi:hypothetical protein
MKRLWFVQVGTFDDGMTGAIDIGDKEVTFLTVDGIF